MNTKNQDSNLIITMEEAGELIRACSKVIRHGVEDPKYLNNLVEEMGDVKAMITILVHSYNLDVHKINEQVQKRLEKMQRPDYE